MNNNNKLTEKEFNKLVSGLMIRTKKSGLIIGRNIESFAEKIIKKGDDI